MGRDKHERNRTERLSKKGAINNGKIFLSQRQAVKELRSHHNEIARWCRELQHYGFIVQITPGSLGVNGRGTAPQWRLTELGYLRELPTKDYLQWDGTKFQDRHKTKSRAGIPRGSVLEMAHTAVLGIQHTSFPARAGNGAHGDESGCAGNPAHTKNTTAIGGPPGSRLAAGGGRP